ncbi:MAG TPA: ABC transporter ATP-binding protein [Bryobacteraceae bacterium]|nr:ABC transporter ATP-binding protein [Bryobacteraceae bacterium]
MTSDNVIETHALAKRYGDVDAVHALSFQIRGPSITGFLGRNGAGKSSTIRMLLGMIKPTAGSGMVLGHRIDDPKQSLLIRRRTAYIGEEKGLYAYMTVEQLVRFTSSFYPDWRPDIEQRLLRMYQLPLRRKVKALSKGMRTKLALLLALSRRPALLILDEPTEGLDPVSIEELLQMLTGIAAEGTTVFFSSHQLAEVERIADSILIIERGRLVLDVSLDHLRENYRRVTAGFPARPPEAEFRLPGVERVRASGRQITVLASRNADAIVERARSLSAVSVEVEPVSLREIFLDAVRTDAPAEAR